MRHVAIFRHNLFKPSEPFIAAQAERLLRYRPLYLGRQCLGVPPPGARLRVLDGLPAMAWHVLSARPAPFLQGLAPAPALVHAHFGVEGVYALPLAARLGVPLVTTFHGFDATLSRAGLLANPAWMRYALGRGRLARRGELFLCASAFLQTRLLALGFPPARTRVHYIGVDCAAISPRAPEEETPVLLHVARLEPVKGTAVLLRAFALLAPEYPGLRLVVLGEGSQRAGLQAQTRALGLAARVAFLGVASHAEVLRWMRRAMLLAQPSIRTVSGREEGLGLAVLEAAATGVPAVGSALGGIPETIIDGETGYLVPPQDPPALAAALRRLLDDAGLRRRMGAAARARVLRQFDFARQTAALEDLYDGLLGGRE